MCDKKPTPEWGPAHLRDNDVFLDLDERKPEDN